MSIPVMLVVFVVAVFVLAAIAVLARGNSESAGLYHSGMRKGGK